eukprot:m.29679 g.29679  ORF g.29679 m.29679 type:complete len:62 (+) comp13760_c0_seq3:1305-1490(+)
MCAHSQAVFVHMAFGGSSAANVHCILVANNCEPALYLHPVNASKRKRVTHSSATEQAHTTL